ncbi:MAG: TrmB family transcriptional regulator [Haloarculaceae archaeon]
MDDDDATESLTALGLSTYAARTFVGLQKLGVASASEVAQVTDVPRSQVYGATDELEDLGLVDVQEGSPRQYRPVGIEEARDLLYDRLRSTADDAFDYLESIREQRAHGEAGQEAIWTTQGRGNITSRITSLVAEADERVLFGTADPTLVEGAVVEALTEAADRGASVRVATESERVHEIVTDAGLDAAELHDDPKPEISVGRVLVVDGDTVLVSVLPTAEIPHITVESAFWSEGTGFATIISSLVAEHFG